MSALLLFLAKVYMYWRAFDSVTMHNNRQCNNNPVRCQQSNDRYQSTPYQCISNL